MAKLIVGVNDLATVNPELAKEWNYEKNGDLKPTDVTISCGRKVWWTCEKGHEWQSTVTNRSNRGDGCPYCSNHKVLEGYNDLASINPQLAKEWNYERNGDFKPTDVTIGSNKKVWWKCSKNHEWKASIANRIKGRNCPYCSNKKVLSGYNDLASINPQLAKEWNYERNGGLKPTDVVAGSNKNVWWKCNKGHEWRAMINNRSKGIGCPYCSLGQRTSFPEYALWYYLYRIDENWQHTYKDLGFELDLYNPKLKIAIEYDGQHWHKDKCKNDLLKNKKCNDFNIKLYRVRENLPTLEDTSIDIIYDDKSLNELIKYLIKLIYNLDAYVDIDNDLYSIYDLQEFEIKSDSIAVLNPELAKEWNYDRNGKLTPENVSVGCGKKVWWKCQKGHEWQAVVYHRNNGSGCPYCSGRKAIEGQNDLVVTNPKLAKEWNYEKNGDLKPENISAGCGKKVWWKCDKGHEWQATINSRNKGIGCPYCSGYYVIKGQTDLATVNPILAKEWDYIKNGKLKPTDVSISCGKKVWWKCDKGHEWQARVADRTSGQNCPYCSGRRVLSGFNDLATLDFELAKEWNYDKNGDLKPTDVTISSGKKVWWKCQKGHEYQATVDKRHNKGRGCPYCSNKKVLSGYNDLATTNPQLAKEWNYERNGDLKPTDISTGSAKKVWWICPECSYEWQSTVDNRNRGNGCPNCHHKITKE